MLVTAPAPTVPFGYEFWYAPTTANNYLTTVAFGNDGTIYIGSGDKSVYAFNPKGLMLRSFETGAGIGSGPALYGGIVYISSYDGYLYAIDQYTGNLRWKFQAGSYFPVSPSPTITSDGVIYIGNGDGYLYALSTADATVLWKYKTGGSIWSKPLIGPDNSIYFGSFDKKVYALHQDGTFKWSFTTGSYVVSSPAISADGSTIYIGSYDSNLYALRTTDGSVVWTYATDNGIYSSPTVGPDGWIYFGSFDFSVYALSAYGRKQWSYKTRGIIKSSAVIGPGNKVYIGSNDFNLYAFDGSDGTLLGAFETGSFVSAIPAISVTDGSIIFGSEDGYLYSIQG